MADKTIEKTVSVDELMKEIIEKARVRFIGCPKTDKGGCEISSSNCDYFNYLVENSEEKVFPELYHRAVCEKVYCECPNLKNKLNNHG